MNAIRKILVTTDLSDEALPGIDVLERDGPRLTLRVGGALDPLLALLADAGVADMTYPEPELEEAFARFYGEGAP